MSRVINTNNPTRIRNQHRRTIAEILRRLSEKPAIDSETKDMAAMLVYLLREIDEGVEQTVKAWEKRDYWMKAERFLREWSWVREMAANLEDVIRNEAWELLPRLMVQLFPRFGDIQIKTMTRSATTWQGAFKKLSAEAPRPSPW
jgi:hypothetical protein